VPSLLDTLKVCSPDLHRDSESGTHIALTQLLIRRPDFFQSDCAYFFVIAAAQVALEHPQDFLGSYVRIQENIFIG
jgi:hypothetical protein